MKRLLATAAALVLSSGAAADELPRLSPDGQWYATWFYLALQVERSCDGYEIDTTGLMRAESGYSAADLHDAGAWTDRYLDVAREEIADWGCGESAEKAAEMANAPDMQGDRPGISFDEFWGSTPD